MSEDIYGPSERAQIAKLLLEEMIYWRTERVNLSDEQCFQFADKMLARGFRKPRVVEREQQLEDVLRLILPLAKGYASEHRVGSNSEYVAHAEGLISPPEVETGHGKSLCFLSEGSDLRDSVAWAICEGIHSTLPEDKRSTGWMDLADKNHQRILAAADRVLALQSKLPEAPQTASAHHAVHSTGPLGGIGVGASSLPSAEPTTAMKKAREVFRWALTPREIADVEDAYEMSWEEIMMCAWPPKPVNRHKDAPHTAAGRDGDGR